MMSSQHVLESVERRGVLPGEVELLRADHLPFLHSEAEAAVHRHGVLMKHRTNTGKH